MGETEMPTIHFNRDRRRSSFTRPMRDPEEILEGLRSLKAAKRELGRTMSLSGDKRRESREYGYVASLFFLGLNHFRLNRSKSFAPPFQFRSSIRADCLPVCLSVSFTHTLVDLFLYSSSSSSSLSLFLSLIFLTPPPPPPPPPRFSIVGSSIGSIHPRPPADRSRSNLPHRPPPCVSYACE